VPGLLVPAAGGWTAIVTAHATGHGRVPMSSAHIEPIAKTAWRLPLLGWLVTGGAAVLAPHLIRCGIDIPSQ
jgi:hypothetical protein